MGRAASVSTIRIAIVSLSKDIVKGKERKERRKERKLSKNQETTHRFPICEKDSSIFSDSEEVPNRKKLLFL